MRDAPTRSINCTRCCSAFVLAWLKSARLSRPLFLTPKNEAGVRKLVCTSLRPTLLPHTDLYDLPGIVQFVTSYFAYEPLDNPVHYPDYLPSPSSVISWQVCCHLLLCSATGLLYSPCKMSPCECIAAAWRSDCKYTLADIVQSDCSQQPALACPC